jgi:hypothetical protein
MITLATHKPFGQAGIGHVELGENTSIGKEGKPSRLVPVA